MKTLFVKSLPMKSSWPVALLGILVVLGIAQVARAQMGDVGMAMGAAGIMNNNPIAQSSQQTQQAAALVGGQANAAHAPAAAATPAAGAVATPATAAAVAAAEAPAPMAVPAPAEAAVADLHSPFKQSLFFSPQDIIAIKKASQGQSVTASGAPNAPAQVIPMNRFISVAGISYKTADNWVVWINGRKVVKGGEGVLKELVDLKVQKDYVDLLWFDIGLNGTIKIKMRPNQTYYIVPGLLLPGVAVP